ncbi:MAG: hypothetical protein CME62_15755 [Halobacteriovoraceae bacterium]|nr:hypothetical protein [Halobacteriovoraceae bacterium]|tara:strand:+ start:1024 stop:2445 length:1422 start_codon:yes stop_codon:yes gene_type:complete
MRYALSVGLLLCSLSAHAVFQKLYQGYKSSDRLAEIKLNNEIFETDLEIGENRFDWQFNVNANHTDSFLQRLFSFQFNQTISQTLGVGFSKSSYKYGTFTVSHNETIYDISNWSNTSLSSFSSDKVFESNNSLTYTYNLLNDSLRLEWDELQLQNKANKVGQSLNEEQDHLDFFTAYLGAKLRIILDQLNRDFENRAKRRVSQISRRVTDGLSRRVDLHQANLSLINQKEAIIRNESELRESVATIENIIKIKIEPKLYNTLKWSYKPSEQFTYLKEEPNFKQLDRLKLLNELTEIQLLQVEEQTGHSLDLNLSYTKNAFNENRPEAFDESLLAGNNDEKVIGLVYTIPLGTSQNQAVKRKLKLQQKQNQLKLSNLKDELSVQYQVLEENIARYESAIKLLNQRVATANKVVVENQRYYTRGQVTFEETLQSEVNYINARVSLVNMFALYENALAQKAFLTGSLYKFLAEYKD